MSCNLPEAEMCGAFARRELGFDAAAPSDIEWIIPDRSLTREFEVALAAGYLRGADLWHLATAL